MTDSDLRALAEKAVRDHDWYAADQGTDFNAYFALFPEDEWFIALASPDRILALLDRLDKAEAALERLSFGMLLGVGDAPGKCVYCQQTEEGLSHLGWCPTAIARAALTSTDKETPDELNH